MEGGAGEKKGREGVKPAERTLVIIPTYNERENLPRVVAKVLEVHPALDILVVDDASPDGTGTLAETLAKQTHRLYVFHRQSKEGIGRAYVAGFRWGMERDYTLFFQMDADLSHPPEKIPEMMEAVREAPVVVGSRYVGHRVNVVNWPLSRLIISVFGSYYARAVTGLPVMDATGGFNLWRREVLERLPLHRIESNGYTFQIEMKYRAWRKGFAIREIPIVFVERESGRSKMSRRIVLEAVWKVWKLRLLDCMGRL